MQQAERQFMLDPIATQMGQQVLPSGTIVGNSFNQQQIDQSTRQWEQQQLNRDQVFKLLGLVPETVGPGGLLGSNFFSSIFGNSLPGVVGGVSGALGPVLGGVTGGGVGGGGGQAQDVGAGGGGLFGELLAGRGQLGGEIMNLLSQFGGSERERIANQASNLRGSALAGLEARGLGSSSLAGTARKQAEQFESSQRGQLEDRLIQQRVGALQGIGEGLFGSIEGELQRQLAGRGQALDLISSVFGSALNVI